ncbi:MAG: SUMF1/EgtB/PvdO family nonheme iron enzyme [Chloroflexota bacterium]
MNLNKNQRELLFKALLSAYPGYDQLARMVSFELDEKVDQIAGSGPLNDVSFKLIEWAEAQGKLKELIAGAINQNAGNQQLAAAAKDFALWLAANEAADDEEDAEEWLHKARPVRGFLCHASQDKPRVLQLYEYLQRDGVDPWLDVKNLRGGQNWQIEIPKAVARSDVILVCFSSRALKSDGFIQEEMRFALEEAEKRPSEAITIIPVRFENVDIPVRFARWHWINLFDSDGYEGLLSSFELRAEQSGLQAPKPTGKPFLIRPLLGRIPWRATGAAIVAVILFWVALAGALGDPSGFVGDRLGGLSTLVGWPASETPTPTPSAPLTPTEETEPQVAQKPTATPTITPSPVPIETATPDPQALIEEAQALTKELQAEAAIAKLTEAKERNLGLELDLPTGIEEVKRTVAISLTLQGEELLRTAKKSGDPDLLETSFISATALFTQAFALAPPPEADVYVRIPAGVLEPSDGSDEPVQINEFWMRRTEVTNQQYQRCVDADFCQPPLNDHWDKPESANLPVTWVTWDQANAYAEWVGGRLPTEAEWEWACRGDDGRIYPWGNQEPSETLLNYNGNNEGVAPVGSYPEGVNPFGLYDMAGNVWEWTADEVESNPNRHWLRGGGYWNDAEGVRCAARDFNLGVNFGFRVVLLK